MSQPNDERREVERLRERVRTYRRRMGCFGGFVVFYLICLLVLPARGRPRAHAFRSGYLSVARAGCNSVGYRYDLASTRGMTCSPR